MCLRSNALSHRLRRCSGGFTLVELLVVIGIIGMLVAILLPALAKARVQSRNTVCAARIHQMLCACTMYQNENRVYPAAVYVPMMGDVAVNFIPVRLLNDLSRYLDYPILPDNLSLSDVPQIVQCPLTQDFEDPNMRGPVPLPGGTVLVSGFQYTARLDEQPNPDGVEIQPARCADARGKHRAVILSDFLGWYSGSGMPFVPPAPPSWAYFHSNDQRHYAGIGMTDTAGLRGQNRGWTDGSVEWVNSTEIPLDVSRKDTDASYRVGNFLYYWF